TQAVSIALGCSRASVVLAGNDMGFTDSYYARGCEPLCKDLSRCDRLAPFVSLQFSRARRSRHYEIRRNGRIFYTNAQFLAGKAWLEKLFKEHNCPVYDCSLPGCSETSVIKTDLNNILAALL
ncbi:MAG: hypothetical protein FWG92_04045, partial [Leptospirales bacterium]|nr:hypothetical protein [Leptospirales bacterium]